MTMKITTSYLFWGWASLVMIIKWVVINKHMILGGGFLFSPLPGEMIQFDEHIFQMGGSTTN